MAEPKGCLGYVKVQDSGWRGQNCSGTVNWKTMFASLDPDGLSSEPEAEDNFLVRLRELVLPIHYTYFPHEKNENGSWRDFWD